MKMAEDISVTLPSNACCVMWEKKHTKLMEKYTKLESRRNMLREGLTFLNQKFDLLENQNASLKQEVENLKVETAREKNEKEKECAIRISLEDELSSLKLEMQLLQQNANSVAPKADGEVTQLQQDLEAANMEITCLKQLLQKERVRADSEKQNAEKEKKRASEASKRLKAEISKASEAKKLVDCERKKAEENRLMLERLKAEADEARSKLASERSMSQEVKRKAEAERRNATKEREQAEMAMAKAEEEAETNLKNAMAEKSIADDLSRKLEEERKRVGKLEEELRIHLSKNRPDAEKKKAEKWRKAAEEYKKKALEENHRADNLSADLEGHKQRILELQRTLQEVLSYRSFPEGNSEMADVKLLKKQLKLEKILVKHAKQVAKVEVERNNVLSQEVVRLKVEFLQLQQRLKLLDSCLLHNGEGIQDMVKYGNLSCLSEHTDLSGYQKQLDGKDKLLSRPRSMESGVVERSEPLKEHPLALPPVSGTDSKAEPLYGSKMLQSSAINSRSASFSDRTLVGSQERGPITVTSAKLIEDKSNAALFSEQTGNRHRKNAAKRAEDSIQTHNMRRIADHCHKRKRSPEVVESVAKLIRQDQDLHEQVSARLSSFHDMIEDKPAKENLHDSPCRDRGRPCKKKNCIEGDGIDSLPSDQCILRNFDDVANYDYIKLLELDDDADEKSYHIAIASPVSPTLPDIELLEHDENEPENSKSFVDDSAALTLDSVSDSQRTEGSFDPSKVALVHVDDARCHQIQALSQYLHVSDEDRIILSRKKISSMQTGLPIYCVLFSDNRDRGSISKIFQAVSNCKTHCSLLSGDLFVQNVQLALLKTDDLSSKEKASVLFSLLLHRITEVEMSNSANFSSHDLISSFDSFMPQIHAVLLNADSRRMFLESCDSSELLSLNEDFLMERKVMVFSEPMLESSSELKILVNDNELMLADEVASARLLLAGSILLASFCVHMDQIGFLCETSCNMLMMQKPERSVVLTILHVVAHLCGSRYFTVQQYGVEMTVVKSLVMTLEKQSIGTETLSKTWSCSNCPFSEGAVPIENAVFLLLEKLHEYSKHSSCMQNPLELVNSIVPQNLRQAMDILSLLELVASFMSWKWNYSNIVCPLIIFLESCTWEHLSAAIIILLGQLGRFGVDAFGYEDAEVEKLQSWLSELLCRSTSRGLRFPIQLATVNSLLGLAPIKIEEIVVGRVVDQANSGHSIPSGVIRKWFLTLSDEQKSSFKLELATTGETDCGTASPS